jgi:pimeloyl-ACP methyl ester carboxylesterase
MVSVVRTEDGRQLSVESWGDPRGKPVFLLHGTPGSRSGPRPRAIRMHGIRLIAYDRPGYGGSDRLPGRDVAHAARDVAAIADALDIERFAVMGRSGGAPHALACAALLPRRVTRAAALVGLAPRESEGLDWYSGMTISNVESFMTAERSRVALAEKLEPRAAAIRSDPTANLPFLVDDLPDADREVLANMGIRNMLLSNLSGAFANSPYGWIDDVHSFVSPWGFDLSRITVPVLLWHGGKDVFVPLTHTLWLAKRIHTASLTINDGEAHFGAVKVMPHILRKLVSDPIVEP